MIKPDHETFGAGAFAAFRKELKDGWTFTAQRRGDADELIATRGDVSHVAAFADDDGQFDLLRISKRLIEQVASGS